MSPKQREIICQWKKNLTSKNFSKCTKKLTSSPARSQKNLSLGIAPSTVLAESLRSFRLGKIEATLLKCPPGGYFRTFWEGMCRWDP